ncbi:hypothetical protein K443DRAFT_111439 [Laccaria amethystina LaAM-08-1]|uniref:Uncharacterized protein n=1 Tax=Laccaria amethystina LaAM-08-1 TaxID=1095629 RepID=A0A0C9WR62_9AGAR|nr:hypothetical protein K443DRAFT_111439 [Laccaria amethystina LaAM-08-1]
MSDPNDPRKNQLKCKFEGLPDQVTTADRPLSKRRVGLISAPPTSITPSSTADIAMPVTSDQAGFTGRGVVGCLQQVFGISTGLVLVDTELTVACEIPFNLFARKLILTFINSNITADQAEGSVDFLAPSSSTLTGSCLLQISIFYF